MTRLLVVLASAAVAAVVMVAAAGAATLSPAGDARFPDRSFVLSLPTSRALTEKDIRVTENGKAVSHVAVIPAGSAERGDFAVVLALDASQSMRGRPIEAAVEAARAFAEQKPTNQQVAIITFNRSTAILLPFTTDATSITAALTSPPPLAHGTRIYDAVATAERLLDQADVAAGSIILLSDGADTGSVSSRAEVAAAAEAGHQRIFSVGLRGRGFAPETLESLAVEANGRYAEATSSDRLASIYRALGSDLASEYLVRYRSLAGPHEQVEVKLETRGLPGSATAEYVTPALPAVPKGPFHRSFAEQFLRSPASMIAAAFLCGLLAAAALVGLVRPRKRTLLKRMAEFVSVAPPKEKSAPRKDGVLVSAERSLERASWWPRFEEELDVAGIKMQAIHVVAAIALGTLVLSWLAIVLTGQLLFGVFGLVAPFVVRSVIRRKRDRQRTLFAEQLPDNVQVLASALRAGHSLVGALSVVVDDAAEPGRTEFGRVVADEQLGIPLDESLLVVSRRMASRDLEQVALVSALQQETGGNTAEVLESVAETVRERFSLRRLVKTLTAQGRMSRVIVTLLPLGLLGFITVVNPAYVAPLYDTSLGRLLLILALVMVLLGWWVIGRIVDIKV